MSLRLPQETSGMCSSYSYLPRWNVFVVAEFRYLFKFTLLNLRYVVWIIEPSRTVNKYLTLILS